MMHERLLRVQLSSQMHDGIAVMYECKNACAVQNKTHSSLNVTITASKINTGFMTLQRPNTEHVLKILISHKCSDAR